MPTGTPFRNQDEKEALDSMEALQRRAGKQSVVQDLSQDANQPRQHFNHVEASEGEAPRARELYFGA